MRTDLRDKEPLVWPLNRAPKVFQASYRRNRPEFVDRFGLLPDPLRHLFKVTALKLRAAPHILENSVRFVAEQDSLNASILGPDAVPGSPEFDLFVKFCDV